MKFQVKQVLMITTLVVISKTLADIKNIYLDYNSQKKIEIIDLSQLKDLSMVLRQAEPTIDVLGSDNNVTVISAAKQGPCSCGHGVCSCCSRVLFNLWKQKVCVNITYSPDEFEFTAKVVMNDHLLYKRTVSGKNPSPVCVPVPQVPAIRACVRFYNIYFQGRNVHACVDMEGKFQETTLFKIGMDCLRLGTNGVALLRPEDGGGIGNIEILPENNSDGEEEYSNYEDYDDDNDYLFDY